MGCKWNPRVSFAAPSTPLLPGPCCTRWDIDEWLYDLFGEICGGSYFIGCQFIPVVFDPLQLTHWLQSLRGSKELRLGECWGKCWYLYLFFHFFPKDSTFDNVPVIALWMANYSVITWGFVILFRVAKSEFNISRCCFSFLLFFPPPSLAVLFGFLIEEIELWIYTHSCII